jgi:uncharacterized membrane protein
MNFTRTLKYLCLVVFLAGIGHYVPDWMTAGAMAIVGLIVFFGVGNDMISRRTPNDRPLLNPNWARPLAGIAWGFALVSFVQWLNDGVEYIGDTRTVASAPGTAVIVLTTVGIVLLLLSFPLRKPVTAQ